MEPQDWDRTASEICGAAEPPLEGRLTKLSNRLLVLEAEWSDLKQQRALEVELSSLRQQASRLGLPGRCLCCCHQ